MLVSTLRSELLPAMLPIQVVVDVVLIPLPFVRLMPVPLLVSILLELAVVPPLSYFRHSLEPASNKPILVHLAHSSRL